MKDNKERAFILLEKDCGIVPATSWQLDAAEKALDLAEERGRLSAYARHDDLDDSIKADISDYAARYNWVEYPPIDIWKKGDE